MKIWKSWKLYVGLLVIGILILIASGPILGPRVLKEAKEHHAREQLLKSPKILRGPTAPEAKVVPPAKLIYPEIKYWVEAIAKLLMGLGGIAGSIKAILGLFSRKKKEEETT